MTKKNMLKTLLAAFVISSVTATAGIVYTVNAETSDATAGISSFEMQYGASVRKTAGSTGIRFTATFDETLYNAVQADENKQFGMLITNNAWVETYCNSGDYIKDLVSDKNYILITESEADEEAGNVLKPYAYETDEETGEVTYAINGVVTNIQYSHSDWAWFGLGVVLTTDGNETTYEYANYVKGDNVRTVAEVASAALEYESEELTETEKETLMEYVYRTAYDVQGVSKEAYDLLTKEEKAASLAEFSLTTNKSEYYGTLGEASEKVSVLATNGEVSFPVRAQWTSSDNDVAKINSKNELTVTGRGYAALTPSSTLFASDISVPVYTGETALIREGLKNAPHWSVAQVSNQGRAGTIAGENYYRWGFDDYRSQYYSFVPSDISYKYLTYMQEQGYAWVRMNVYFENATRETVNFRIAANADSNVVGERFNQVAVPTDQWISMNVPLQFYLDAYWNKGEGVDNGKAVGNGFAMYTLVDEYGMLSIPGPNWRTPVVITTTNTKSYWGDVTLMKDSVTTVTVTENNMQAKFAEDFDLSKQFTVAEGNATYTVNGVPYYKKAFVPVLANHEVSVNTNVFNVAVELPIADGSEIQFTKSNAVTAALNVTDGVNVKAVNLVDTESAYDIDAVTGAAKLKNAGLDVAYSIVKRYSDGTPMATLDVAKAESGIYYYSVNVLKDSEVIATYETTLDLYKESEGCEYESFKHNDSQYAVKSYYGWMFDTYLTSIGGKISVADVTTLMRDIRTVDWINNYHTCDDSCAENCALKMSTTDATGPIYALNLGKTAEGETVNITNYKDRADIGYLEINWTKYKVYEYADRYSGTIDVDGDGKKETGVVGNGVAYLYTYVLPRHTKEYYEAKSVEYGQLAMAYKTSYRMKWNHPTKVENSEVTLYYQSFWSSTNQSDVLQSESSMNIATIINNYDAFANAQIPMQIAYNPYEFTSADMGNPTTRLYELFFIKNS